MKVCHIACNGRALSKESVTWQFLVHPYTITVNITTVTDSNYISCGLTLWLTNSIDDYSEKYGMMGGLVQKPVTALVIPGSWASDWPELLQQLRFWLARGAPGGSWASDLPELLQQLSFWLARAAPAAEILIGQSCSSSRDFDWSQVQEGRNRWKSTSCSASTSHILSNHL